MAAYIEVLPSAELARFNLKGLSPDMFYVNIADMVNMRGLFSGQVENERQIPVARWLINHEDYLLAINAPPTNLTHLQIVSLLAALPGYVQEADNQYLDFEESVVQHTTPDHLQSGGYRLSITTEESEGLISSSAYYNLDTLTESGWLGSPPPEADHAAIRTQLGNKLEQIRQAGVQLTRVDDETDYASSTPFG